MSNSNDQTISTPETRERVKVWEAAAREVENGRFLTNESPEYNFGQKVAMMLRRKAQEAL